jgi:hypothetical protein
MLPEERARDIKLRLMVERGIDIGHHGWVLIAMAIRAAVEDERQGKTEEIPPEMLFGFPIVVSDDVPAGSAVVGSPASK